jgi:hypothetical protein
LQKTLVREWEGLSLNDAIDRGIDAFADAYRTGEPGQRMAAFISRRQGQ